MCVYVCTSVFHNLYVDIHIYIFVLLCIYALASLGAVSLRTTAVSNHGT